MTKSELIQTIAQNTDVDHKSAEEVFNELCDTFEEGIADFYKLPRK